MSDDDKLSLLPIGRGTPESTTLAPIVRLRALQLYQQAWEAYRQVGCPYGETDDAMLVWYTLSNNAGRSSRLTSKN